MNVAIAFFSCPTAHRNSNQSKAIFYMKRPETYNKVQTIWNYRYKIVCKCFQKQARLKEVKLGHFMFVFSETIHLYETPSPQIRRVRQEIRGP